MRPNNRFERASLALSAFYERLWYCRIRDKHREKFSSNGACIRCGKPVR